MRKLFACSVNWKQVKTRWTVSCSVKWYFTIFPLKLIVGMCKYLGTLKLCVLSGEAVLSCKWGAPCVNVSKWLLHPFHTSKQKNIKLMLLTSPVAVLFVRGWRAFFLLTNSFYCGFFFLITYFTGLYALNFLLFHIFLLLCKNCLGVKKCNHIKCNLYLFKTSCVIM